MIDLAVSTGAAYQKSGTKKLGFGLIGAWHAVLQLSTPFVLIYFADWRLIIILLLLVIFTNGFSGLHTTLKFLIADLDKAETGWKKILSGFVTWRFGAAVMKKGQGGAAPRGVGTFRPAGAADTYPDEGLERYSQT